MNLANGKYHCAIDIIHGSRSLVDFEYNASWIRNLSAGDTITRELSDMMFLVFSKRCKCIRLMYMQNKKGDSSTKFKADMLQLCLLKNRCVITSSDLHAHLAMPTFYKMPFSPLLVLMVCFIVKTKLQIWRITQPQM